MSFKISSFPIKQASISIAIFIIATLCYLFDDTINIFDYHKSAIIDGQWWRLFTGHLFHTNGYHLLLNLAGITLLTALHIHFYRVKQILLLTLFLMLFISTYLLINSPLEHYVGLSGMLHGLFAWGALKDICAKEKTGILLFLGLWLKVIWEQIYGASPEVAQLINANVAIEAHLAGAIGGCLFFLLNIAIDHIKK